jgi:hypothetical protein
MHQIMYMSKFLPREDTEQIHSLIVQMVNPRISWETLSLKAVFMTTTKGMNRSQMTNQMLDLHESMKSMLDKKLFCNSLHLSRVFKLLIAKSYQLDNLTKIKLIELQCRLLKSSQKLHTVSHLITLQLFDRMLHEEDDESREMISQFDSKILESFKSIGWSEQVRALWGIVAGIGFTKDHYIQTAGFQVKNMAESYVGRVLECAKPQMDELR